MGELATKIRAKFPGTYDDMTDSVLESKITAKYPGVYDDLVTDKPAYNVDLTSKKALAENQKAMMQRNPDFQALPKSEQDRLMGQSKLSSIDTIKDTAKSVGRAVMPYVRPVMEGGGAALGAIAGAPVAPATMGLSSIGGAGLGYAMGAKGADVLETLSGANSRQQPGTVTGQTLQSLSDIGTGATYEMGGQAVGTLAGMAIKKASPYISKTPLKDMAERRALKTLEANSQLTLQEQKNLAQGTKLSEDLGVKLTPAQMTGKPAQAALEQNLAAADPTFNATLNAQDSAAKQTALLKIRQSVGTGKQLPVTQDLQTTGANVVESVQGAQKSAKQIHEALYDEIPNMPQSTQKIKSVIKMLKKDFRPGDEDVFPSRAISRIEEAIEGPKPSMGGHGKPADPVILDAQGIPIRKSIDTTKSEVGFQDLHSLRKDIGRQIQDASTGMKPNRELAAKLTTIKKAIDETIEESMGADNQYKAAKDAFIDYANKYRTGSVNKVLAKGNESSGLRIPDENISKQFYTQSGAEGLIKAIGKTSAKEQMKPFVTADLIKTASPDGMNFNVQSGLNYINKNRVQLEKLGLVKEAQQIVKDQIPAELEKMLAKRAPDATGSQFFTAQDMRTILQKYGNTIKQMYGVGTLQSFRDYNQLMGMIERKNMVPRSGGSNTAEKAINMANSMIKESVGPAKQLTDGLLGAIAQGAGYGTGVGFATGGISAKTAIVGSTIMAGRQLAKNANSQVSKTFVKILQDATINPQIAKDIMAVQRTGKVPESLKAVIEKHLIGSSVLTSGIDNQEEGQ